MSVQLARSGNYRARVWEYNGKWHLAIEAESDVVSDRWYELSLDSGGSWWEETYSIYHLHFADEITARREAARLLTLHRAEHERSYGYRNAAKQADVIT